MARRRGGAARVDPSARLTAPSGRRSSRRSCATAAASSRCSPSNCVPRISKRVRRRRWRWAALATRRATGALVAALGDRELAVAAAGALARIGDADAFDALIGLLGDPDAAIRQAVIAALNSIGHPEMPQRIATLLDDADPTMRESALKIAGYFGYPTCLTRVLARCRDPIEAVRRTAVEQLPFFDDPQVHGRAAGGARGRPGARCERPPPTRSAASSIRLEPTRWCARLNDADPWVRYVTAEIAGRGRCHQRAAGGRRPAAARPGAACPPGGRRSRRAADARRTPWRFWSRCIGSANEDIARAAIGALGHVDQPEALAVLEREARAPASVAAAGRDRRADVRRDAGLSRILQWVAAADGDAAVVSAAVGALTTLGRREDRPGQRSRSCASSRWRPSRSLRPAVIAALSSLPPRRTGDIAAGLRHASPAVRCAIAEALGRMKQPDASRALEGALDDAASPVRLTAVAELKHLGTRTSQRKLMQVARTDPDAEVRRAAMLAVSPKRTLDGGRCRGTG